MTTVTSLPALAASASASTSSEDSLVRYSVCLMETTAGSLAAWRTQSMMGVKDW